MVRVAPMIVLAGALVTVAGLAPATDLHPGLTELMQRIAVRRHGHATFVERQYLKVLDRPLESSGELLYQAPDRLEKRTLSPKPEILVLDKGTLSVTRGGRTYRLAAHDYPQVASLVDSIRATVAGDLAALERSYRLSYQAVGEDWTLVLAPRARNTAALIAQIRIAGRRDVVREVTVLRADGDRSVMTIREVPDE